MATLCLKCGVATAVGVEMGHMGLPSLDETPRGRGKHALSARLFPGGDADTDETFGCLYSGLLAVGLSTHPIEAYRDFLREHSGSGHALRVWVEEHEDLPEGARKPRFRWYKSPRRAPGFTWARVRFACSKCEELYESAAAEWVRPFEPRALTKEQVKQFSARTVAPSESNIRDAWPFEILLFHDFRDWLRLHADHALRIELLPEPRPDSTKPQAPKPTAAEADGTTPALETWTPPAMPPEQDERLLESVSAQALPWLARLHNRDPRQREAAARALESLAEPGSVGYLAPQLDDPDAAVRVAVVKVLAALPDPRRLRPLGVALLDEADAVREAARRGLADARLDADEALRRARAPRAGLDRGQGAPQASEPAAALGAVNPLPHRRAEAARKLRSPGDASLLVPLAEDCSRSVVEGVAEAAGALRLRAAVEPLCAAAESIAVVMNHEHTVSEIVVALGKIGDPACVPTLVALLDRWNAPSSSFVPSAVVNALAAVEGEAACAGLVRALGIEHVEGLAAEFLGRRKDPSAVPGLIKALENSGSWARACAAQALVEIGELAGLRALVAAAIAGDAQVAEAVHLFLIENGDPRTEAVLVEAIQYAGVHDKARSATAYLLSGHEALAAAGKASLRGRAPVKGVKPVAWGSRPLGDRK